MYTQALSFTLLFRGRDQSPGYLRRGTRYDNGLVAGGSRTPAPGRSKTPALQALNVRLRCMCGTRVSSPLDDMLLCEGIPCICSTDSRTAPSDLVVYPALHICPVLPSKGSQVPRLYRVSRVFAVASLKSARQKQQFIHFQA